VFGFGGLCIMVEGRCLLSSYVTGESPNMCGVCSPAKAVRWEETANGLETRLGGLLIDRYAPGEPAGYPTLCKGRFTVADQTYYAIEEPTSLNTLELLPELHHMGIAAIKIEGRQRSPAYVTQVTKSGGRRLTLAGAIPRLHAETGMAAGTGQGLRRPSDHAGRLSPDLAMRAATVTEHQPKLALGPVLYYWPKEKLLDFYERISAAPVDIDLSRRNGLLQAPAL
jgi:collagenase-like PrtC family protease